MKIIVRARTRARVEKVERLDQASLDLGQNKAELSTYRVSVKEAPVAGQANQAIIRALAEYFAVAKNRVRLVTGQTAKQKIFEIV